jgi:ribonuclease-3 family protein
MDVLEINVLVLAYLGDTIYEDYIRKYLIYQKIGNVNTLQTASINYVSAKAQAKFLLDLIDKDFFTEEELSVIKRARNYKSNSHPKNCDIITYKYATGLEALIGYLELSNERDRIDEIMDKILGGKEEC